jgi:heme-degrading monooxygenase HmoA
MRGSSNVRAAQPCAQINVGNHHIGTIYWRTASFELENSATGCHHHPKASWQWPCYNASESLTGSGEAYSCEADREGRTMFASIRKYNVRRGSAEELARRVREGFVPMMRQMQGFRGYYLLDGGPDVLITISIFDSADEAFASNEKAANWVRNNVLESTKGLPEVMVGDALIAEVK